MKPDLFPNGNSLFNSEEPFFLRYVYLGQFSAEKFPILCLINTEVYINNFNEHTYLIY